MAVAAAAAVVAAVGVPDETRDDEAITGAAGAPVVTIMVEDSQPMPTLTQNGAAALLPQLMSAATLTVPRTVMP